MATVEELRLAIKAEVSDAVGKLKQFQRQTKETEQGNKTLSQSFASMRDIMQGPMAAANMVAKGLKAVAAVANELYDEWATAEQAGLIFNQAIKDSGTISAEGGNRLKDYAQQLQNTTIFEGDATLAIMANLAAMGKSEDQIQAMITAAAGYASATGIDMDTAVKQLNSTLQGNAAMLGRQNAAIKALTPEQLRNGEAIAIITKQYAGMAEAVAGGAGGSKIGLANAFGDLKEEIGALIAEQVKPATGLLTDFFNVVANGLSDARNLKDALGGGEADIGKALSQQRAKVAEQLKYVDSLTDPAMRQAAQEEYDFQKNILDLLLIRKKAEDARIRAQQENAGRTKAEREEEERLNNIIANRSVIGMDHYDAMAESNQYFADLHERLEKEMRDQTTERYIAERDAALAADAARVAAIENEIKLARGWHTATKEKVEQVYKDIHAIVEDMVKINKLTEGGVFWGGSVDVISEAWKEATFQLGEYEIGLEDLVDKTGEVFGKMGASIVEGESAWKVFAKSGLDAIASLIEAQGKMWALEGLGMMFNPLTAGQGAGKIALGISAQAAAGAVRAIPMAEGGIVKAGSGGIYAHIGEGKYDEAVVPLDGKNRMGGVTVIQNIAGSVIAERNVRSLAVAGVSRAARGW